MFVGSGTKLFSYWTLRVPNTVNTTTNNKTHKRVTNMDIKAEAACIQRLRNRGNNATNESKKATKAKQAATKEERVQMGPRDWIIYLLVSETTDPK